MNYTNEIDNNKDVQKTDNSNQTKYFEYNVKNKIITKLIEIDKSIDQSYIDNNERINTIKMIYKKW